MKNCFDKYDEVIVMSRLVVQVWEMDVLQIRESIFSETIINSKNLLGKKPKRFEIGTCLMH